MKEKIIEILKSKIKIKSTVMTDYCDPPIKSDITGFEQAAQEISALLEGEGEYYQKVYIKSEADLPRDGIYIAHYKMYKTDSPAGTILSQYDHLNSHKKQNWLERIDWYLQPVSLPDKDKIIQKQEELIQNFKDWCKAKSIHDDELALAISIEAKRLESELANLKKQ